MEAVRRLLAAHSPRWVGVLLAGVGAVGDAFVRVLQERFCTTELQVRVLAIGDSKGFVATQHHHGFDWDDVAAILDHKKQGHAVPAWESADSSSAVIVMDGLVAAVQHFHAERDLDDYVVVDLLLANKLPVGGPFEQYQQLTHGANGRVWYETTIGAGLPVISVVQRMVASRDSITRIQGGLSGTMTYILSAINRGALFSVALQEVHDLGITENDPREDLSGADVARKMTILARELGLAVETSDVEITPLLPQEAFALAVDEFMRSLRTYDDAFKARVSAAKREGRALAYIGTVYADGALALASSTFHRPVSLRPPRVRTHIVVYAAILPVSHLGSLPHTAGTECVVSISSEWSPEPLLLRGTGAGASSTAAAIAGDLAALIHQQILS